MNALVSGFLLLIALWFGVKWLFGSRSAPCRRADDPAADPHAEPYGEVVPGWSAEEIAKYPPNYLGVDLGSRPDRQWGGRAADGKSFRYHATGLPAGGDRAPLACICRWHKPECDCADGKAVRR